MANSPTEHSVAIRLAHRTIALNSRIIRETQEGWTDEDIGTDTFGPEGSIRRLAFIFEQIPLDEAVHVQTAYLLRAIMCSQIFNDGNKRTAVVLAIRQAMQAGFRVEANQDELYHFIVRRFGQCPRFPMTEADILARDRLFQEISTWLAPRMRRINTP